MWPIRCSLSRIHEIDKSMRRIQIYDTTLRDGSQAEGVSFSLQDKLLLAERLDRLGFDFVEGGYPASNEKDAQFFQKATSLELKNARICAFGMTRRKGGSAVEDQGLAALIAAETPVITIVGKSSAFQAIEVIKTTCEENLTMIAESIDHCRRASRDVIFDAEHFFDGWKEDPEYAISTLKAAEEAGAETVVLCDTNGGSMSDEVTTAVRQAVDAVRVPVGIHIHNDCGLAVANSIAAVDAGACQVQGTINGFGERCGNADLIQIIANLTLKKQGYELLVPDAPSHLTELSRYVYEMVNMHIPLHQPFVGKSAFAHKGGMHVSGVSRNTSAYEHIEPERVGNERRVLVSELSGRSNIVAMTTKHNIQNDKKLLEKILTKVVSKEHAGYQYEAAEGSFDLLVRQCAGTFTQHFTRLNYRVNIETDASDALVTEATVKIQIGDRIRHEVAEGDGPVNALDQAMRKALHPIFPCLREMHLVDYKVRVINSEAATAAGVRVVIESRDADDVWGTVGVSENIIEASWIALVDSIEYKLFKEEQKEDASKESSS